MRPVNKVLLKVGYSVGSWAVFVLVGLYFGYGLVWSVVLGSASWLASVGILVITGVLPPMRGPHGIQSSAKPK